MNNHELRLLIREKKSEIHLELQSLRHNLKEAEKNLTDSIDYPEQHGINVCGINQNQHILDIKTGELKALINLYRRYQNQKR